MYSQSTSFGCTSRFGRRRAHITPGKPFKGASGSLRYSHSAASANRGSRPIRPENSARGMSIHLSPREDARRRWVCRFASPFSTDWALPGVDISRIGGAVGVASRGRVIVPSPEGREIECDYDMATDAAAFYVKAFGGLVCLLCCVVRIAGRRDHRVCGFTKPSLLCFMARSTKWSDTCPSILGKGSRGGGTRL
jgi:hypothetical protein